MSIPPLQLNLDVSDEHAKAFLNALAYDPDFRDQLVADPAAALSQFGISVPPESLPSKIELPSADDIAKVVKVIAPLGIAQSSCMVWGLIAYCARELDE